MQGVPISLCLVVGLYWIVNTIDIIAPLVRIFSYILFTVIILTITIVMWQLHRYPQALIPTLAGYGGTYLIMGMKQYRDLKKNIRMINENLA